MLRPQIYYSTSVNKDAAQNATALFVKWIMFWHAGSSHEALEMREGEGGHLEAMIKENSIKNIWNPNCQKTAGDRGRQTQLICAHPHDVT